MTTKAEYDAGDAAALAIVRSKLPPLFKNVPVEALQAFASSVANAAIDAAAAMRAKVNQQT